MNALKFGRSMARLLAALALASYAKAYAGNLYWDGGSSDIVAAGNGASGGTGGTWDTTILNWDQGNALSHVSWTNANNDTAVFAGTVGTVSVASPVTVGGLVFSTASYILTNGVVTFGVDGTISNSVAATIWSSLAGSAAITKVGAGTLSLAGTNSYTGTTTINGGTLNLGNATANGSLSSTNLSLGGATFSYTRTGSTTQSFDTVNITAGANAITSVAGDTITLGDVAGRSVGGTVNFGSTGTITTSTTNDIAGILGGWATFNNGNWAVANGAASAITGGATYQGTTAGGTAAATYLDQNMNVDNSLTIVGVLTTDSIRFNSITSTVTLAAGDNVISSGGILFTSTAGACIITNGNLAGSSGGDLIFHQNSANAQTIFSVIKNNGSATALTKAGTGQLVLTGAKTYTGNTYVNGGTLTIGITANTPATPASLGSGNYAGNIFIASGATLSFRTSSAQILSGVISGEGNFSTAGSATTTLTGTNTYSGKTTVAPQAASVGGNILSVSSFNSVNGGTPLLAGSSLGCPTTVANGTITIGATVASSSTLKYTGTGETTDRVLSFNFNSGGGHTLDASNPSGLLKFTSAITGSQSGGTPVLTLSGTGSGELAGNIPNIYAGFPITKSGAGSWTLSGTNLFTGGLTLSGASAGSRLNINSSTALGSGTFTISGGNNANIDNTSGAAISNANNNAMAWSSDFSFVGSNPLDLGTGNVTLGANRLVIITNSTLTVGGVISGAFSLTVGGAGTLVLNGASTFSGKVVIGNNTANSLKLRVNGIENINVASPLGKQTGANAVIQIGASSNPSSLEFSGLSADQSTDRQIQVGSSSGGSGGALIFNNDPTYIVTFANAAFNVAATGVTTFNRTLTLQGSNTGSNTIQGAIIDNVGTSGGRVALAKSGSGKWVVNGANTYSAATTINAGTLVYNGSLSVSSTNSAATVNGGILAGTGTIARATTVNAGGTLMPGDPVGTLTIASNLTLNAGATNVFALGASTNSASVAVTGDLTIDGALTVTDAGGFGLGTNTLFTYAGTLTDNGLDVNPLPGGFSGTIDTNTAGQVNLVVTGGGPLPPVASFTATPTNGTAPLQVVFTDSSINTPTGWAWDFDNDGNVDSTDQNPTNVFSVGTYSVKLVVTNAYGSSTNIQLNYITATNATPPATGYDLYATGITNGLTGYQDDGDGDGYANLLEYVTGGDANNADNIARMNGTRVGGLLALQFTRTSNSVDTTLIVEGSNATTNDANWIGIATNIGGSWGSATNIVETNGPSIFNVTAYDTDPSTNRFLRLRVTRP